MHGRAAMNEVTVPIVGQKLEDLKREHAELEGRLAGLKTKIAAFEMVIAECRDESAHQALDLHGLSIEDALVKFAAHHGGELMSTEARSALVDTGLLDGNGRTATVRLYTFLSGSDRFESTGERGKYRLVDRADDEEGESEVQPAFETLM